MMFKIIFFEKITRERKECGEIMAKQPHTIFFTAFLFIILAFYYLNERNNNNTSWTMWESNRKQVLVFDATRA